MIRKSGSGDSSGIGARGGRARAQPALITADNSRLANQYPSEISGRYQIWTRDFGFPSNSLLKISRSMSRGPARFCNSSNLSCASATRSSDRLVNSSEAVLAFRPKRTSPATPKATLASATTGPQWLNMVSGGAWNAAANPTSRTNPNTTAPALQSALRSSRAIASFKAWSVLFIYPYRGSGKGAPHPAVAGLAAVIVILLLLLARHLGLVS